MANFGEWSPRPAASGNALGGLQSSLNFFSGATDSFGTAFGDFALQSSDLASAKSYAEAANIAGENLQLSNMSTKVSEIAAARKVKTVLAAQQAGIAGSGFEAGSGTGLDLLMEGTRQGYLTQQMLGLQGEINANAYQAQEDAAMASSSAAKSAAGTAGVGGIMGAVGGVAKLALGVAGII